MEAHLDVPSQDLQDLHFNPDSPLVHIREQAHGYLTYEDVKQIKQVSQHAADCVKAFLDKGIPQHTVTHDQIWWSHDKNFEYPLLLSGPSQSGS